MAFRRFTVRLNGGVAGPGSVAGFNLGNHADLTDEEIAGLTAEEGHGAFRAVTDDDIPASSSFTEDYWCRIRVPPGSASTRRSCRAPRATREPKRR